MAPATKPSCFVGAASPSTRPAVHAEVNCADFVNFARNRSGCGSHRDRPGLLHAEVEIESTLGSSEYGTFKTVKARFWPWFSGKSRLNLVRCSLLARKRTRGLRDERSRFGDIYTHTYIYI